MRNALKKLKIEIDSSAKITHVFNVCKLPRNEHLWNVTSKSLGHLAVSDVGNALHRERDVDRIAA